jgi:hypothetical protein
MSKIFEIVRPKSIDDPAYADFEYLIRWIGRDGAEYLYMFYDADISQRVNSEVVNRFGDIAALIDSENREITLTANDLTKNDLTVIAKMFSNTYVTRLLQDGTTERYAPKANSFSYRLMGLTYDIEFTLIMQDLATIK